MRAEAAANDERIKNHQELVNKYRKKLNKEF